MPKPVERINLSDQVFQQPRDEILNREIAPGQRLPSERDLCDVLQVNRSSVREALKRLEQARLIEIRHGEGSIVLDFKLNAGFDLLGDMLMPGGTPNLKGVRSILELRSLIAPEIARLAAMRIDEVQLAKLAEQISELEDCPSGDVGRVQKLDFEFHYSLVQAGENLAYLLLYNSARELYLGNREYFTAMFADPDRYRALYRKIYKALVKRDSKKAALLCAELMDSGNEAFGSLFQLIEQQDRQALKDSTTREQGERHADR